MKRQHFIEKNEGYFEFLVSDFGFETHPIDITFGDEQMLHNVLKQNQDDEQQYIKSASEILKKELELKYGHP